MTRLRLGDEAAYETLVRTYGPRMLTVARRYFSQQEDAEDVLQSAFVLVIRFIHGFEGNCQLSTWLHRIVVNSALMRIRSRTRHPEQPLRVSDGEDHYEARLSTQVGSSVLEEFVRQETRARLLRAVESLPDMVRTAVRLRIVDGLTLGETALLLGRSVTSVKAVVRRGRIALRAMLAFVPEQVDPGAEHLRLPAASGLQDDARQIGHRTMLSAGTTLCVPRLGTPVVRSRIPRRATTAKTKSVVVSGTTSLQAQPPRSPAT